MFLMAPSSKDPEDYIKAKTKNQMLEVVRSLDQHCWSKALFKTNGVETLNCQRQALKWERSFSLVARASWNTSTVG